MIEDYVEGSGDDCEVPEGVEVAGVRLASRSCGACGKGSTLTRVRG